LTYKPASISIFTRSFCRRFNYEYKRYFIGATKRISIICAIAALAVALGGKISAATIDYSPQFKEAARYSTTISANKDVADIYYPKPSDLNSGKYSGTIVLLLQGALVDKSFYSDYASLVARYGFVVVVPNHFRPSPVNPTSPPSLASETSQIAAVNEFPQIRTSQSFSK